VVTLHILIVLIRCVNYPIALSERNTGGFELQGYSPVLFGVAAFVKVLTIREGYGPL
jgi:hypothetical protein